MVPLIVVTLDGRDISNRLGGRILQGEVVQHDGKEADELTLTISNHDGALGKPKRGAKLGISVGFEETGGARDLGDYTVQTVAKLGPKAVFEVSAHAADFRKTLKQQKTRAFKAGTALGDVVSTIAGDHGLTPKVSGDLASIKIDKIEAQTSESDMHFLTRLGAKYGAMAKPQKGFLLFLKKHAGANASGAAMPAIRVTPQDLEGDFRIADKDRPRHGKVTAHHYDRKKAKRIPVSTGDGDGPEFTLPHLYGSETEARKAAEARSREFKAAEKTFSATLKTGDGRAVPGGIVTTQGFGDDDDMDWVAKRVTHSFGPDGYVTKFEAETKVK